MLTNALGVSCAYAEYVLRTFNIRSKYAARRLVIRYAYASHTLNKKPRWALAYGNVCERMSNLQVTFMNLCITCSLRTPNLRVTYYQYVGICWKFCACTKFLGVHDVRQRMPAYCSVYVTCAKLMPNVCNVHQPMDKISHTSAYVGAIRCGVSKCGPMVFKHAL